MADVVERAERPGSTMTDTDPVSSVLNARPLVSWRAIFAGLFVGFLTYMALIALGIAFGGLGLQYVVSTQQGGVGLTIGTGIWLIVTAIIALFVGGFVAARASGVIPTRIGGIEGLVVAGLMFAVLTMGLGTGIVAMGRGAASLAGTAVSGVATLAQNPQVQSTVERALGGLNLRSDPGTVVQGLAVRLLRGDTDSAVNYLAYQAGISRTEARQRLGQVQSQVAGAATSAGRAAAKATQITGWVLFATILLASLAALFGGVLGAHRNIRRPLSNRDRRAVLESRSEWSIYGAGITQEPAP